MLTHWSCAVETVPCLHLVAGGSTSRPAIAGAAARLSSAAAGKHLGCASGRLIGLHGMGCAIASGDNAAADAPCVVTSDVVPSCGVLSGASQRFLLHLVGSASQVGSSCWSGSACTKWAARGRIMRSRCSECACRGHLRLGAVVWRDLQRVASFQSSFSRSKRLCVCSGRRGGGSLPSS